jgi:ketosteroid isomerase-like protein
MTMNDGTLEVVRAYFSRLKDKAGWEELLSDQMTFTSFTTPVKRVVGRAPFLEATKRFYSTIGSFEVRDLLVDGDRACALTRYEIRPPAGPAFSSDVAEVFTVREGKITTFDIYFDSAPFPK